MLKIATWDDYVHIKRMCLNFADASPYKDITVDPEKMEELISDILEGDGTKSIIVLGLVDDTPVGMVAAAASEMLLNREFIAQEIIYWIEPEHRGGKLALELMKAYEFWALKVGCTYTQMSLVETDQALKVARLYERKGYTPIERGFLKRVR
jgi:GNAT superfamily N-acetyltransferase